MVQPSTLEAFAGAGAGVLRGTHVPEATTDVADPRHGRHSRGMANMTQVLEQAA